jgi:hypothetical protein
MAKHGTERRDMRHGNDRAIEASANIFREIEGRRFRESFVTSEASGAKNQTNIYIPVTGASAQGG